MGLRDIKQYLKTLKLTERDIDDYVKAKLPALGLKSIEKYIIESEDKEQATKEVLGVLKRIFK